MDVGHATNIDKAIKFEETKSIYITQKRTTYTLSMLTDIIWQIFV